MKENPLMAYGYEGTLFIYETWLPTKTTLTPCPHHAG
jgi:hypothetical protein